MGRAVRTQSLPESYSVSKVSRHNLQLILSCPTGQTSGIEFGWFVKMHKSVTIENLEVLQEKRARLPLAPIPLVPLGWLRVPLLSDIDLPESIAAAPPFL